MQLIVHHRLQTPLSLPINYHHMLQSIIFHALEKDEQYSAFMHDCGFTRGKRNYKLFTFGLIKGKYRIEDKRIIFVEDVTFEIRSTERRLLELLREQFEEKGITYGNQHCLGIKTELLDYQVDTEEVIVRMNSPICVYSTDVETRKTMYYHPGDAEFCRRVNEGFRRRYEAYSGEREPGDISIRINRISPKDKYVTCYKGIYITAWYGEYVLKGKKEYLDFLYQTGLGGKTSQGFGMFDVKSRSTSEDA